jgi:hypothetical protein
VVIRKERSKWKGKVIKRGRKKGNENKCGKENIGEGLSIRKRENITTWPYRP